MKNPQEKIYAWKPIEGLEDSTFTIYSATFDLNGLKIILYKDSNPKKNIFINFSDIEAYRITEECSSMHLLEGPVIPYEGYISPKEEKKQFAWSFFKVENSEYLKWASQQCNALSKDLKLIHYAIWDELWAIDVLSSAEPDVEFVDIKSE